ncbi:MULTISPECIES: FdhF/YdeP family oxidoreductase [Marisediminitalea]|uniref:FdhF/YdeP family oxidoreductase n=1 Tax=Marisediminitalea TaxID=2662254 RepID=UPI0020CDFEB3|nr:FdhF/YdeP family oxidoreductase [Marisediminitalea aggregata]MCP3865340.1 FdhF/YdeP family oxidoreductase [Aestuariibacter sp.]MCP4237281.1 FdhF/YdeP family oxidoreductase [Aestuariibacter sp.]MCP4526303.1 FdhF/YdeP family oxidoreductase [Aestuariibacter sp.]MCP4949271.1 FdhF/YdeP family oxidoreductase [Aestuariibacter sp.]MCP5012668.1 FdhF/YdeP family oxidoreductase [Aestuariibacter sp.]|tara:strand:+ start:488 stop:2752 length:2265 start_codon:yes stop_codon:yes gene_type:complete
MPNKSSKAGGIASVKSTVNQLIKSKQVRRNMLNLYHANKHEGFDCPGCAWGDDKSGAFRFCENGAKAIAWESTSEKVDATFFAQHTVSELRKQSDHWLESQGRLVEPLCYNAQTDKYEPVSWEQAFTHIADGINALQSPNELELYTSGRASNEASFLYQVFGRALGTNNFPDCSNMCHEASGIALKRSIGVGKGTVTLKDFDAADTIFVFGQNPGTNHPRMLNALRSAAKRGATIVSFNNLKEVGLQRFASPQKPAELLGLQAVDISAQYYTPKLGGDFAVARGMAKVIIEELAEQLNQDFIDTHTHGIDAYIEQVKATQWQDIETRSGLTRADITEAASLFVRSRKAITCWAMGITQHLHSVDTIHELTSLHLLTGAIGLPGAGMCPVRGHSNVQGNRTMGILEAPTPAFNKAMQAVFDFTPPEKPGHRVYDAIKALHTGQSKMLICLGGNIAAASADTAYTEQALRRTTLMVNIATKLNRTHLAVGQDALILPCLGRTEADTTGGKNQAITVEDTFSMVHASSGNTPPASDLLKSETEIIARIAQYTLKDRFALDWESLIADYSNIRELIAKVIPGFDNFNAQIQQPGGFHLYNSAANLQWNTASGKAEFNAVALPEALFPDSVQSKIAQQDSPVFTLQTLRSHDQYNTTVYGMNDRYRGVFGERQLVFMHAEDMRLLGLTDNSLVDISTIWDDDTERKVTQFRAMSYDIPQGNVACYYPETNPLIPFESVGLASATPTSKSVPVVISHAES